VIRGIKYFIVIVFLLYNNFKCEEIKWDPFTTIIKRYEFDVNKDNFPDRNYWIFLFGLTFYDNQDFNILSNTNILKLPGLNIVFEQNLELDSFDINKDVIVAKQHGMDDEFLFKYAFRVKIDKVHNLITSNEAKRIQKIKSPGKYALFGAVVNPLIIKDNMPSCDGNYSYETLVVNDSNTFTSQTDSNGNFLMPIQNEEIGDDNSVLLSNIECPDEIFINSSIY
jgi:hypothetical protein